MVPACSPVPGETRIAISVVGLPLPAYVHNRGRRGTYKVPVEDLDKFRITADDGGRALVCLLQEHEATADVLSDSELTRLFPKQSDIVWQQEYLIEAGVVAISGDTVTAKHSFYIYPPTARPLLERARQRQQSQQQLFIDLSQSADIAASAEKARNIFAKYGKSGRDGGETVVTLD
eukprot:g18819.t1